jgi:N-acetylglucosamine repressor
LPARLRSANRRLIRQINEAVILGLIHDRGPIARTDIADAANLSPATVTGITAELIDQGLVFESEAGASTGGRPPVMLEINRGAGCVAGVKLTERTIIAALTDLGAEPLIQRVEPLDADRSAAGVAIQVSRLILEMRAQFPKRRFYGAGVGLAGAIDRRAGICRFSPFLHWRDVPLRDLIETGIDAPVVIENDVSALTLAERWFGHGSGLTDFIVVTLGRGVGLGMVFDGRLYRGGRGAGGEFGHLPMDPTGPLCDCGNRGCLEAIASEPAVERQFKAAFGPIETLASGVDRFNAGDESAIAIFTSAGETLGRALAGVVNVLNPTRIIIGGEGVQTLEPVLAPLRRSLAAHCFEGLLDDLDLIVEPWGDEAWARGAAGLMLDELFHARLDRESTFPAGVRS